MMRVYKILTAFNYSQTSCVVADSMAEAERLFKKKYGISIEILKIELLSEYVIISPYAEKESK